MAWTELPFALVTADGGEEDLLAVVAPANGCLLGLDATCDDATFSVQVVVHTDVGVLSRFHCDRSVA